MKQQYGVFWPTPPELTGLIQEAEIKGPIESVFLPRIYRRPAGKTLDYHVLGKQAKDEFMERAAKMALANECDIVYYDAKQRVSTKDRAIIIAMNFEFYQSNMVQVYRNEQQISNRKPF